MSGTLIQKWSIGINRIDLYSNGINTYIDGIGHAFAWPVGYPNVERSYYQSTKDLGYGHDTMLMCQEHEAAHTLVCYLMGLPYSMVIHGIITGRPYSKSAYEEDAVLAFQRYCRLHSISILSLLNRYHEV
jgi:hypothetical protein